MACTLLHAVSHTLHRTPCHFALCTVTGVRSARRRVSGASDGVAPSPPDQGVPQVAPLGSARGRAVALTCARLAPGTFPRFTSPCGLRVAALLAAPSTGYRRREPHLAAFGVKAGGVLAGASHRRGCGASPPNVRPSPALGRGRSPEKMGDEAAHFLGDAGRTSAPPSAHAALGRASCAGTNFVRSPLRGSPASRGVLPHSPKIKSRAKARSGRGTLLPEAREVAVRRLCAFALGGFHGFPS